MTFFRNFTKTICATNFTKPNNYLLVHRVAPTYLCTSPQPSIQHLNTLKALLKTVEKLQNHKEDANYKSLVTRQLKRLTPSVEIYKSSCVRYVENGGRLNAQALANLYAYADKLGVNSKWLETYAQSQIPHLIRFMSVDNLKDLQAGLKKFNGSTNFAELIDKQLTSRNQSGQAKYVRRVVHQIAQFQQTTEVPSQHLLINSIESKSSPLAYYARKALQMQLDWVNSYFKRPFGYQLH